MHAVVNSASSLAPERIVNSSGDMQARRVSPSKTTSNNDENDAESSGISVVTDAAICGGREVTAATYSGGLSSDNNDQGSLVNRANSFYAKEVLALPLALSPGSRSLRQSQRGSSSRSMPSPADIEPFFFTSYSNDLLCRPHRIHNCSKRNIVIKMEVRKVEWDPISSVYIALPARPVIHNQRRGDFLVSHAFSGCAYHVSDPLWLDEFKLKLPTVLDDNDMLLFSAYNVSVKGKRKTWNITPSKAKAFLGSGPRGLASGSTFKALGGSSDHGDNTMEEYAIGGSMLDLLGCGMLPLTSSSGSHNCLLANDTHDVKLMFSARPFTGRNRGGVQPDENSGNLAPSGTLVLETLPSLLSAGLRENERVTNQNLSLSASSSYDNTQSSSTEAADANVPDGDVMILQVRTFSLSSVHAQSQVVARLLTSPPYHPRCLTTHEMRTSWTVYPDEAFPRLIANIVLLWNEHLKSALFEKESKLTASIIDICRSPPYEQNYHFLRIMRQLWRRLLVGLGEPSFLWANAEALIPLRLHSFSTLLCVINTTVSYQARGGTSQLDGQKRWNLTTLGMLATLVLDEAELCGQDGLPREEKYDQELKKSNLSMANETFSFKSTNNDNHNPSTLGIDRTSDDLRKRRHPRRGRGNAPIINATEESNDAFASMLKSFAAGDADSIIVGGETNGGSKGSTGSSDKKNKFNTLNFSSVNKSPFQESSTAKVEPKATSSSVVSNTFGSGRRKYMTIGSFTPSALSTLATISEAKSRSEDGNDDDDSDTHSAPFDQRKADKPSKLSPRGSKKDSDTLDREMQRAVSSAPVKQMRIPKISSTETNQKQRDDGNASANNSGTFVMSEIKDDEEAGAGFLDRIGKQLGVLGITKDVWGEERPVGTAHHRKTRSRCSIDWSLPATDNILEKHEEMERMIRNLAGGELENENERDPFAIPIDGTATKNSPPRKREGPSRDGSLDFSYTMNDAYPCPKLRDFSERIVSFQRGKYGKWWPFLYEVIIYQWVALLLEQMRQTKSGDQGNWQEAQDGIWRSYQPPLVTNSLKDAALQARGVTIGCAPFLFEAIKKSLGWRVSSIFEEDNSFSKNGFVRGPVSPDPKLLGALGQLISMVTDACIDSRNFGEYFS